MVRREHVQGRSGFDGEKRPRTLRNSACRLLRSFGVGQSSEAVIFNAASNPEGPVGLLWFNPHHTNLTLQISFQMLSIRVVSWDFEGTYQQFAGGEGGVCNTVEAIATEIARLTLDSVRCLIPEQQYRPVQSRARSLPALR